jgi:hypothetical protein
VHGRSAEDLLAVCGATPQRPKATPEKYLPRLRAAGLDIVDVQEWNACLWFTDVSAIVYYVKAVPWLVPDLSVRTHGPALLRLEAQRRAGQKLTFTTRAYLIEAHKLSADP